MTKILHIITGLGSGGAENMLYKLLKYSQNDYRYHEVISLIDKGIYGEKIEKLGIKVHYVNISRKNIFKSIKKIRRISKKFDVLDTWLYHSDLVGFVVGKLLLRKKVVWNIRHSNLDKNANKSRTLKIVRMNSLLSRGVESITFNSNKALENHLSIGYFNKNTVVIPNGFELDKFKYDPKKRSVIRAKLNLEDKKVIITVGRWNVQKDYYTLLKALKELKKQNTNFKMLMVGTNLDSTNMELVNLINKNQLNDDIILLGRRGDVPELLSGADVYVSSSIGESFSNSIGEALACELPCVVTDVGDSKLIVGETGKVVQSGDYVSMSNELLKIIEPSKQSRNIEGRKRIIENYEVRKIAKMYKDNLNKIIKKS